MKSPLMQTEDGQWKNPTLFLRVDFPSVGASTCLFAKYWSCRIPKSITDDEALNAFQALAKHEGIIPAFGKLHALAHALK